MSDLIIEYLILTPKGSKSDGKIVHFIELFFEIQYSCFFLNIIENQESIDGLN